MKDSLIDLEMADVVDVLRVYAALGQESQTKDYTKHKPKLFANTETKSGAAERSLSPVLTSSTPLPHLAIHVMTQLQRPILHKLELCSIANLGDILLAYSMVSPSLLDSKDLNFVGKLEKSVIDKVISKDYFNSLNTTRILWALAKTKNELLVPSFNQDVSAVILQRSDLQRAQQIIQIIPKLIAIEILEKKKTLTPMNSALTLYSMAAVGFYDQEFYESIMIQFKNKPSTL